MPVHLSAARKARYSLDVEPLASTEGSSSSAR
jgi:hypothetical protein